MTEPDPMFQEMIRVQYTLSITSARTKYKFDDKMRTTVKALLGYRYTLKGEPIYREREEFDWHLDNASILSDIIFRVDSSKQRQLRKNEVEWKRTRPFRIYTYVQKLADIFPAEHLIQLLRSSQRLTAEELIALYEANKGEAKMSDYSGEPTGIDPTKFKTIAKLVRKI